MSTDRKLETEEMTSCIYCEQAHEKGEAYPYRIGAEGVGYGTILIIGCKMHTEMAIDLLNDFPGAIKSLEKKFANDLKLLGDKIEHQKTMMEDLDRKMERLKLE